jgi:hypothetical protein
MDANAFYPSQGALRNPKLQLLHSLRVDQLKSHSYLFVDIERQQAVELLDERHRRFF